MACLLLALFLYAGQRAPTRPEGMDPMTALQERMNAIERTACLIAGIAVGAVFFTLVAF